MKFPRVIAAIIAEYCAGACLKSWVDKSKLDIQCLVSNPMAWEAGMIDTNKIDYLDRLRLLGNPAAKDYILANIEKFELLGGILCNPSLEEYILTSIDKYRGKDSLWINNIWTNTNPNILKAVMNKLKPDWNTISMNPSLIKLIRINLDKINPNTICANPAAIDIIQKLYPNSEFTYFSYLYLAQNPHPWAIEQMRKLECPYYYTFCKKPGFILLPYQYSVKSCINTIR